MQERLRNGSTSLTAFKMCLLDSSRREKSIQGQGMSFPTGITLQLMNL